MSKNYHQTITHIIVCNAPELRMSQIVPQAPSAGLPWRNNLVIWERERNDETRFKIISPEALQVARTEYDELLPTMEDEMLPATPVFSWLTLQRVPTYVVEYIRTVTHDRREH